MLSIVIPAYNEEQNIKIVVSRIQDIMERENIIFELLFIDDGSKDKTWDRIEELSSNSTTVRGITFSRNFGKEAAVFAGLAESRGDCVVVMDCDLQHPPEKIVEMYRLWESGFEIVEGVKSDRGDEGFWHRFGAKLFYKLISGATDIDMSDASDFKLLDKKVVYALINMHEKNAFFRALSSWVGFKSTRLEYDVQKRENGESKWSTKSLFKYAIINITSFTTVPMQLISILGVLLFIVCIILSVCTLYQKIMGYGLGGFTTVIILQCFTSSILMIGIGIVGYYVAKVYEEVKGRPRYIISKRTY